MNPDCRTPVNANKRVKETRLSVHVDPLHRYYYRLHRVNGPLTIDFSKTHLNYKMNSLCHLSGSPHIDQSS